MSKQNLHVRRAVIDDLETIVRFNITMAMETERKTLDPSVAEAGARWALKHPDVHPYYLCESDDRVVAQAAVTREWSDWRNGFYWWLQSVYVEPDYRGRGVFRALYEHIRTQARSAGDVCGLRLYVHVENRPAIEVYRRLGMSQAEYLIFEED